MMPTYDTFKQQVQRNIVALISVFIAVSSLSYNTWRNEKSEHNRNLREGAFQVLANLSELREITFHLRWDTDTVEEGALRSGWVKVLTIRDLSQVLEPPVPAAAESLRATWNNYSADLTSTSETVAKPATNTILGEIDTMRDVTLAMLGDLD